MCVENTVLLHNVRYNWIHSLVTRQVLNGPDMVEYEIYKTLARSDCSANPKP